MGIKVYCVNFEGYDASCKSSDFWRSCTARSLGGSSPLCALTIIKWYKVYKSPQVLQKKTTNTSTTRTNTHEKRLDISKTPAAPPSHTFLRPNSEPSTLEYTYSIGRTRREIPPNTPHTSIPDTKNGSFQRDWNHTT